MAPKILRNMNWGCHPIMIGDTLQGGYQVVDKLGFGGYLTVWLARDVRLEQYVAVKIGIADGPDRDSLRRELKALQALSTRPSFTPLILDEFEIHGPNGAHPCYTTVPARCNLRDVSYFRLFHLDAARALAGGLALAVAYTHSKGYVHGDIHLSNILIRLPSNLDQLSIEQLYKNYGKPGTVAITQCNKDPLPPNIPAKAVLPLYLGKKAEEFTLAKVGAGVLLCDFEEAFEPVLDLRQGKDCHTPLAFRAPEAHFEPQAPLSYQSDIWGLATAIWEILGMKAMISLEYTDINKIISQHIDVLGPLPYSWWESWEERHLFFDGNGKHKEGRGVWPPIKEAFEESVQKYRRMDKIGEFDREEASAILDLMCRMLAFRPEVRPTAEEMLNKLDDEMDIA
ncbi:CMGC/SRPK protein kinase [Blastomyces percursus]|uniref:CMGC/SRPK protein kinase n=1 Tax=Blastomyces percursus TaxID=1658174 RepID=A0A1J9P1X2_9EURO|nr:CMGC/SRPK protein kinase [Blastomyces percursus]